MGYKITLVPIEPAPNPGPDTPDPVPEILLSMLCSKEGE
jgi:hypothetical protein